jgi:hypothetical protein
MDHLMSLGQNIGHHLGFEPNEFITQLQAMNESSIPGEEGHTEGAGQEALDEAEAEGSYPDKPPTSKFRCVLRKTLAPLYVLGVMS